MAEQTLKGKIYLDISLGFGDNSLHFDANEDYYVSFEHRRYRELTLDDGVTPHPKKLTFQSFLFDPFSKTLECSISFYPSSYEDISTIHYSIHFSDDLKKV